MSTVIEKYRGNVEKQDFIDGIIVDGVKRDIVDIKTGHNELTITVGALQKPIITEDATFEIIDTNNCPFDVKRIENRLIELGALEDIPHEEIKKAK